MRISDIRKVWHIPGVDNTPTPKPRKRMPPWVVATSASGHRKILFSTRDKRRLVRWLINHPLKRIAPNGITISRKKAR